jgi:hypothetical protein
MEKRDVSSYTRPYNKGIGLRDDTTIASIVLYTNSTANEVDSDTKEVMKGNLGDLTQKVIMPSVNTTFDGISRDVKEMSLDGRHKYYGIFNNIVLTGVQESHNTIQKMHLNFSDSWNVFFFSDNPVMLSLNGGLLDSPEYPYYQEFMTAYDNFLSGTKATSNKLSMILSYDGKVIDGYLLGVSVNTSAALEGYKQFSMQFLAKKITWTRYNYVRNDVFPDWVKTEGPDTFNALSNVGRLRAEGSYVDSMYPQDSALGPVRPVANEALAMNTNADMPAIG